MGQTDVTSTGVRALQRDLASVRQTSAPQPDLIEAQREEMAKKDAEIARLKGKVDEYHHTPSNTLLWKTRYETAKAEIAEHSATHLCLRKHSADEKPKESGNYFCKICHPLDGYGPLADIPPEKRSTYGFFRFYDASSDIMGAEGGWQCGWEVLEWYELPEEIE